jgi:hypothetical protein
MGNAKVNALLMEISHISNHYKKMARLTGENFNVFNVLRLETNEVRTHSAVLCELLNPKGYHGQSDLFLKLFVDQFGIVDFDTETSIATVEEYIGIISEDHSIGGRIDILITDSNRKHIIIENKVFAADQYNQLVRYYNFDDKASLFYLTLDGSSPSAWSINGKLSQEQFKCISYKSDIIFWLEKCKKEAVSMPIIRETIVQYINLLKELTGQSNNNAMTNEIVAKIVKDNEYLSAFFEIHKQNIMDDVKRVLISRLRDQIENIESDLGLELIFDVNFGFGKDTGIKFSIPNSQEGYIIYVFFCGVFNRLIYGICSEVTPINYNSNHKQIIFETLGQGLGWGNWLWVADFEIPFKEWNNNVEPWLAIIDASLIVNIKAKVQKLHRIIDSFNRQ